MKISRETLILYTAQLEHLTENVLVYRKVEQRNKYLMLSEYWYNPAKKIVKPILPKTIGKKKNIELGDYQLPLTISKTDITWERYDAILKRYHRQNKQEQYITAPVITDLTNTDLTIAEPILVQSETA